MAGHARKWLICALLIRTWAGLWPWPWAGTASAARRFYKVARPTNKRYANPQKEILIDLPEGTDGQSLRRKIFAARLHDGLSRLFHLDSPDAVGTLREAFELLGSKQVSRIMGEVILSPHRIGRSELLAKPWITRNVQADLAKLLEAEVLTTEGSGDSLMYTKGPYLDHALLIEHCIRTAHWETMELEEAGKVPRQ